MKIIVRIGLILIALFALFFVVDAQVPSRQGLTEIFCKNHTEAPLSLRYELTIDHIRQGPTTTHTQSGDFDIYASDGQGYGGEVEWGQFQ